MSKTKKNTKVEKVDIPKEAPKEQPKKEKPARVPKNPLVIVEVVVEAPGFEKPYHAEGQRANTMKATRAWIRERRLSVRMKGVAKAETKNAKPETDKIVYTFTAECLAANDVAPVAPKVPKPKVEKEEAPKEKVNASTETPEVAEVVEVVEAPADEKPQDGTPSDW